MCCLISITGQLSAGMTLSGGGGGEALASDCSPRKRLEGLGQEAEDRKERAGRPMPTPACPQLPSAPEPEVPQKHGLAPAQGALGLGVPTPVQAVGCGLQCVDLFCLCLQALLQHLVLPQ